MFRGRPGPHAFSGVALLCRQKEVTDGVELGASNASHATHKRSITLPLLGSICCSLPRDSMLLPGGGGRSGLFFLTAHPVSLSRHVTRQIGIGLVPDCSDDRDSVAACEKEGGRRSTLRTRPGVSQR